MIKTQTPTKPAEAAGHVLTYDGQLEFEYYKNWRARLEEASKEFRDFFNDTFDEVLGTKEAFTKDWALSLKSGRWIELDAAIENFINKQNKALKRYYEEHYRDMLQQAKTKWTAVHDLIQEALQPLSNGKRLSYDQVELKSLPFKGGCFPADKADINARREAFNEYLTDPAEIEVFNQLQIIANAYNKLNEVASGARIPIALERNKPSFIDYRNGVFIVKSDNLKFSLSLRTQNHDF